VRATYLVNALSVEVAIVDVSIRLPHEIHTLACYVVLKGGGVSQIAGFYIQSLIFTSAT
jgi:hypothetical protein